MKKGKGALPSLVNLSPSMLLQIVLSLKPLCTLNTVELAQAWQIFCRLRNFILVKVFGRL